MSESQTKPENIKLEVGSESLSNFVLLPINHNKKR